MENKKQKNNTIQDLNNMLVELKSLAINQKNINEKIVKIEDKLLNFNLELSILSNSYLNKKCNEERLRKLENISAKNSVIGGIACSALIGVVIEFLTR
jgi:hypothetical protein